MANESGINIDHMALAFSPEFHRSRLRLIYFSGIGGLLTFFEIKPDSSLFGIGFQNLTAGKIALLFLFLNSIFFLDHIIRLIEEGPITNKKFRSAYQRYVVAADTVDSLAPQIQDRITLWDSECNNFSKTVSRINDRVEAIDLPEDLLKVKKELESKYGATNSQFHARLGEMQLIINDLNDWQLPAYVAGKMGFVRLWIELLSGVSAYCLFLWFAYGAQLASQLTN